MHKRIALAMWLAATNSAWAIDQQPGQTVAPQAKPGWQMAPRPAAQDGEPLKASDATPNATESQAAPEVTTQSGQDPLPPPPSMLYGQARESISPLTPEETRNLVHLGNEMAKAKSTESISIVPRISAQTVDLSPGASLPFVRTAVNYPTSVSFIDSTGAPWTLGAAPLGGNEDFIVYWLPGTQLMTVFAKKPFKTGNVTVYLEGLNVPIVVTVTSGEADTKATTWTVDSRLDLRIPRRGPKASPGAAPESRIGLHDQLLQAFLDGVPPKDARRLTVSGSVPETSVWQLGDDLYVRSRAEIRDEFEATLSSADGTHLWKLPVTPYLSFSVMGRTEALNVALE
ncbi:DotH/IcmK family type IV secretion protein [Pseudomonas fulva]|uniref:DotH/IcmK family type IV secretion protein n=1 Tax=Pseudomonas fulva TaxID=47880 RepID=UPI002DB9CE06|nr:DotH/IcmK family type IV secretion protein [Pseudomonas fulva]MEB8059274.1 conjugal transfer protein TraN [Pseudomonas fulva]